MRERNDYNFLAEAQQKQAANRSEIYYTFKLFSKKEFASSHSSQIGLIQYIMRKKCCQILK